eukprot:tig00000615_g2592.t1
MQAFVLPAPGVAYATRGAPVVPEAARTPTRVPVALATSFFGTPARCLFEHCGQSKGTISFHVHASGGPPGTTRRTSRMAELIKREVSLLLSNGIKDSRVSGMVSVTHVDVSNDMSFCKIFVSIYGSEQDKKNAMDGLKSASGFVRRHLGTRLTSRLTPQVNFIEDRSFDDGFRVSQLLHKIKEERKPLSSDIDSALANFEDDDDEDEK